MARVDLTAQAVTPAGLVPNLTSATADGDVFDAGRVALYVQNDSEDDVDVTIPTPATARGLAIADAGGTVAAASFRLFGPFPKSLYGQTSGANAGRVYADYSEVTSVTRCLISL